MRLAVKNLILIFGASAAVFFAFHSASAQDERATKLRNGVWVKGEVGGDGHQSYFIHARRGQTLTVQISRKLRNSDENFNLTVSRNASFTDAQEVKFGKETSGKTWMTWTGKAPATGNYYFFLTGYTPDAPNIIAYTFRVTVK